MMRVIFTPDVAARVNALVQATDDEVAWFGLGDPLWHESGERVVAIRVDEIYVPTQEVTATTVNASSFKKKVGGHGDFSSVDRFEAFDHWQQKYGDDFLPRLCHFGHSHVRMDASPSQVDKDFWHEWIAGVPTEHAQWLAATIHNQKGEVYAEIRVNAPGVGGVVFDADFSIESDPKYEEWAEREISEKCLRVKPTTKPILPHEIYGGLYA